MISQKAHEPTLSGISEPHLGHFHIKKSPFLKYSAMPVACTERVAQKKDILKGDEKSDRNRKNKYFKDGKDFDAVR